MTVRPSRTVQGHLNLSQLPGVAASPVVHQTPSRPPRDGRPRNAGGRHRGGGHHNGQGGAGRDAPGLPAGGGARSLNPLLFNYTDSPRRVRGELVGRQRQPAAAGGAPGRHRPAAATSRAIPPGEGVAAVARGATCEPDGGLVHPARDRGHRVRVAPADAGAVAERPFHEAQAAGGQEAGRQVGRNGRRRRRVRKEEEETIPGSGKQPRVKT